MWSFNRRRNPLIASANIISPILQHSSSRRLHLSASKLTNCSSFSVFSINVASKSNPRLAFYQRFDFGKRFYHNVNPPPPNSSEEPYHKQFFHKLKKPFENFGNNTVPYTNRNRFLFLPLSVSSKMNSFLFKTMEKMIDLSPPEINPLIALIKKMFQYLPKNDPQSVRVNWILRDIIDALHKDLKKNGVRVKHLDGLNWEIFVMLAPLPSLSIARGRILISARLLQEFTTDAEVATCIGHQVAFIVAGHLGERILTFPFVQLMLTLPRLIFTYLIPIPSVAEKIRDFPFRSLRRHVLEADYIGMILIALAGYDPQVAPSVYLKLCKLYPCCNRSKLCRRHHSKEYRALMLSQAMEEARAKYNEVEASNSILQRKVGGLWLLQKG